MGFGLIALMDNAFLFIGVAVVLRFFSGIGDCFVQTASMFILSGLLTYVRLFGYYHYLLSK